MLQKLRERLGPDAPLPVVDTVERLQGAERQCVVYCLVASDDAALDSPFLLDPRRFNVAITRARARLIVLASRRFFERLPGSDEALDARQPFVAFLDHVRRQGQLVYLTGPPPGEAP